MGPLGLSGREGPWGDLGKNGARGPKGDKGHIGLMVSTVFACLVFCRIHTAHSKTPKISGFEDSLCWTGCHASSVLLTHTLLVILTQSCIHHPAAANTYSI